jgi:hypothetical protein
MQEDSPMTVFIRITLYDSSDISTARRTIKFEFHTCEKERLQTRAVINKTARIGNYSFNLRMPDEKSFYLPEFLPPDQFIALFQENTRVPLPGGFGDIFCILN